MKYDFIKEKIKEVKEEIKGRKNWQKAIQYEYTLKRSQYRRPELIKLYDIATVMINRNQAILHEYEEMLKDIERIDK